MKVWYKLGNEQPDRVKVDDDAVVFSLKEAVKQRWGEHLACVDAPELTVFAAGADPSKDEPLDPGDTVPDGTTSKKPLIVVAPQQQQNHQNQWFCVTGTIERPKSSAGDRFKLIQLARGGYYPHSEDSSHLELVGQV